MKLFVRTLAIIFGCFTAVIAQEGPRVLDAKAFRQKMTGSSDVVLLDVRTPGEVKEGHLAGARFIDFNAQGFSDKIDQLDKSKTYLVYCKAGGRSSKAAELMRTSGFKNVFELQDGYTDWVKKGYPVQKP